MFFSDKLLRLGEGNFSVIWLLGNNICDSLEGQPELGESDFDDRKKKKKAKKEPTRREIMATDVSRMCKEILEFLPIADEHMAFRLTSVLLIGVVDCHIRQVTQLLSDARQIRRDHQRRRKMGKQCSINVQEPQECLYLLEEPPMDLEGDFGELRLGQFSVPNEAITMREVEPILHMEEDDDFGDLRGEEVDPLHFDMDQPVTEVPGEEALVDDLTGALAEVPVEVSSGPMITDEPAEAPGAPQRNGGADIGPPHHTPLPQEEQPQVASDLAPLPFPALESDVTNQGDITLPPAPEPVPVRRRAGGRRGKRRRVDTTPLVLSAQEVKDNFSEYEEGLQRPLVGLAETRERAKRALELAMMDQQATRPLYNSTIREAFQSKLKASMDLIEELEGSPIKSPPAVPTEPPVEAPAAVPMEAPVEAPDAAQMEPSAMETSDVGQVTPSRMEISYLGMLEHEDLSVARHTGSSNGASPRQSSISQISRARKTAAGLSPVLEEGLGRSLFRIDEGPKVGSPRLGTPSSSSLSFLNEDWLVDRIETATEYGRIKIDFAEILPPATTSRRTAAKTFYLLLNADSSGEIEVRQVQGHSGTFPEETVLPRTEYGDIQVRTLDDLPEEDLLFNLDLVQCWTSF